MGVIGGEAEKIVGPSFFITQDIDTQPGVVDASGLVSHAEGSVHKV